MQFISTLATLIVAASAITVNSPAMNAVWTTGQAQTISWSSVSTDPSEVSVYLVNFSRYPTSSVLLASNVTTTSGSLAIDGSQLTTGSAYQINLIVPTNSDQILAQSNQFSIIAGASSAAASSSTMSSTTSSSAPAATSEVTTSSAAAAAAASTSSAASVPVVAGSNSTLPRSNSTLTSTSMGSITSVSVSGLVVALGSVFFL